MPRPGLLRVALASWLFSTSGCTLFFPAPTPMRTLSRPAPASASPAKCAVIFLPGFGDDEKAFAEHKFPDALQVRNMPVDTVTASATYGYYGNRSLLVRLREDVVRPLRTKGYKEIWIVGISMGGLGTVLLARDQQPDVAGIYLLAPYLGDDGILKEINAAGGVRRWEPGPPSKEDYRELWRYLKGITADPAGPPLVYLGAGDQDPHRSPGPHPLAEAIPRDHLFRTPGGHDWGPWSVLWADFLDHSEFRARCGPGP
jgi:pimeloyl-ACP methyl ester carboxylesterase